MSNNTLRLLNNPSHISSDELKADLLQWGENHSSLLKILLDSYCIVDLQGNIVACNIAFETLVEQSQRKILKTPQFNHFLITETTPEKWESVFTSGENWYRDDEVSASIKSKSQAEPKQKKLILAAIPIFSGTPSRLGTLVTIRDVTDESNVQNERIQSINKSNTDGLTQLCNKVFTEGWLVKQIELAHRNPSPISILMSDVDHFKKVNDTYGHQAGDFVLQTVARLLQEDIRKGDVAGRFGGEEFIVVMSNTPLEGAWVVAERFREKLKNLRVEFQGKVIPLTISIGTSTLSEFKSVANRSSEEISKMLIAQCDQALYHAKHTGRNRTCQFETLPAEKKTDPKESKES